MTLSISCFFKVKGRFCWTITYCFVVYNPNWGWLGQFEYHMTIYPLTGFLFLFIKDFLIRLTVVFNSCIILNEKLMFVVHFLSLWKHYVNTKLFWDFTSEKFIKLKYFCLLFNIGYDILKIKNFVQMQWESLLYDFWIKLTKDKNDSFPKIVFIYK